MQGNFSSETRLESQPLQVGRRLMHVPLRALLRKVEEREGEGRNQPEHEGAQQRAAVICHARRRASQARSAPCPGRTACRARSAGMRNSWAKNSCSRCWSCASEASFFRRRNLAEPSGSPQTFQNLKKGPRGSEMLAFFQPWKRLSWSATSMWSTRGGSWKLASRKPGTFLNSAPASTKATLLCAAEKSAPASEAACGEGNRAPRNAPP